MRTARCIEDMLGALYCLLPVAPCRWGLWVRDRVKCPPRVILRPPEE